MRRFTILNLMGFVVALAVGIAALRDANDYWAGGLLLSTPLILCVALVGGLCGKESSRSRRLGFAVFGWTYFALAFLGLSEGNLSKLPTSKLLWSIHERVGGVQLIVRLISSTNTTGSTGTTTVSVAPMNMLPTSTLSALGDSTDNRWKTLLPGAANYEAFQAVGHCLFALLAGLLGAVVARWFEKRRITPG